MSLFPKPTLSDLITRIEADLLSRIERGMGYLRRSITRVNARVWGESIKALYEFIDFISRQMFLTEISGQPAAQGEYLDAHGTELGLSRLAATWATGNAVFYSVDGTDGDTIPAGTKLQSETGLIYITQAEGTVSGGFATVVIKAEKAGVDYNLIGNTWLSLMTPIDNIGDQAVVDSSGINGGTDIETDSIFRARILERKQTPAMGGNNADYLQWMRVTAGVTITRAWCESEYMGPMTVGLFFVNDTADPIFPSAGQIATVQAQVDSLAPNVSRPTVYSPLEKKIGIYITATPDTVAVRAAIKTNLEAYFISLDLAGVVSLDQIKASISTAPGCTGYALTTIRVGDTQAILSVPQDVQCGNGELATLYKLNINGTDE